ncbi:MAG: HAD family phosphatase [Oscillospiraceae bacterium]|nr:HAD family phosphatase [Oscillospiraceae bacterium]
MQTYAKAQYRTATPAKYVKPSGTAPYSRLDNNAENCYNLAIGTLYPQREVITINNVKAIIFDMDGTLLDSLSVWADSDREFITGLGMDYDSKHSFAMKKMHFDSACEYLVREFSLSLTPQETGERILQIVEDHYINGVPLKDGAKEILTAAKNAGIKMCVATSNKKSLAESTLKAKGIMDYMEFVITSDEVGGGKETPEIFLKAAERLGTAPEEAVVFEDSIHAVLSAKSAGFRVVGIYDPLCPEEFAEIEKNADRTIKSFNELLKGNDCK